MKKILLLFTVLVLSHFALAQRAVEIQNLWAVPRMHVAFEGYTISFTIKDINRALQLLAETGDSTFGTTSLLDTAKDYYIELYAGYKTQYRTRLQPLIQNGVGALLLSAGHALIISPKHKRVKELLIDMVPRPEGEKITDVKVYDARTNKLIFNGQMAADMKNKDLGID